MVQLYQFPIKQRARGLLWLSSSEPVPSRWGLVVGSDHTSLRKRLRLPSWLVSNNPGYGPCAPKFFRLDGFRIFLHGVPPMHISLTE